MALIVENGDGLPDAESYVSVAEADSYHEDYGNTEWSSASPADRGIALRRATQWIDGKYGRRFIGIPSDGSQALLWPRRESDAYCTSLTGIPVKLRQATAEAALLIVRGEDLTPALYRGGMVDREAVEGIEIEYSPHAPVGTVYLTVENLLCGIVRPKGTVRMRR